MGILTPFLEDRPVGQNPTTLSLPDGEDPNQTINCVFDLQVLPELNSFERQDAIQPFVETVFPMVLSAVVIEKGDGTGESLFLIKATRAQLLQLNSLFKLEESRRGLIGFRKRLFAARAEDLQPWAKDASGKLKHKFLGDA